MKPASILKILPALRLAMTVASRQWILIFLIYVLKRPAGYVDPSLWDNGIPAALLSYDMNGWRSENNGSTSESAYVGLRYGLNMGPWRLRSRGNFNWDKDSGTKYSSQDVYLQRDITPLSAQFVIGDSYTRGGHLTL